MTMWSRRFLVLGLLGPALLAGTVGCGILSPEDEWEKLEKELNRNWNRWDREAIDSYSLTQTHICECIPLFQGPSRIWVVDGVITRVEKSLGGEVVEEDAWSTWYTVEEMFQLIADAIDDRFFFLEVEYDPVRGFPTRIALDRVEQTVDDERVMRNSEFMDEGGA
jgi:hypothetical protein